MATNHRATIEAVNAAFSNNRLEDFIELCTEDVEMGEIGGKLTVGKDALRKSMQDDTWEAPVIGVTDILIDGDRAVCHGIMDMDKKSGEKHRYAYVDIYTFRDEKIRKVQVHMKELKDDQA